MKAEHFDLRLVFHGLQCFSVAKNPLGMNPEGLRPFRNDMRHGLGAGDFRQLLSGSLKNAFRLQKAHQLFQTWEWLSLTPVMAVMGADVLTGITAAQPLPQCQFWELLGKLSTAKGGQEGDTAQDPLSV